MELKISNLYKTYPNGVKALEDINLTIPQGMFGLLGPNGAGKSTLMRTIATLQEPDRGSIFLDEINVLEDKMALRQVLGYLPQEFGVYPRIGAEELLNHLAVLKGVVNPQERKETVQALLEKTNLYAFRKRSIHTYSGGMKQRFGIAQALIGNPELIIVDEPTAGLDPGERNRFYDLLSEIGENIIVILSTHIVDDVKELCNNMAIIDKGQLLYAGSPQYAMEILKGKVWSKEVTKTDLMAHQELYQIISNRLIGGRPVIHIYSEVDPLDSFKNIDANLEDVFFSTIQKKIRFKV